MHVIFLLKRQILHHSKLKEFADDNFKLDDNGRKSSKRVENTVGKRRNCSFSFSHSVFKRLVLQSRKNQGLFGKGFNRTEILTAKSSSIKTILHFLMILWTKGFVRIHNKSFAEGSIYARRGLSVKCV